MSVAHIPVTILIADIPFHYVMIQERDSYLITIKTMVVGRISRQADGSWYQSHGFGHPAHVIEQMVRQIEEAERRSQSSFGFGLEYENNIVYCEVLLRKHSYGILFDHVWITEIKLDGNLQWQHCLGKMLPKHILALIGRRIEAHFP